MTELERVRRDLDEMRGNIIDLKIQSSLSTEDHKDHKLRLGKLEEIGELVKKRNTQLGLVIVILVFFKDYLNAANLVKILTGH